MFSLVPLLTHWIGSSSTQTASLVCIGFDCQKCWFPLYGLLWTEPPSNFHARLFTSRCYREAEVGGNVENVARACAGGSVNRPGVSSC